jgi:Right handed beta helix region
VRVALGRRFPRARSSLLLAALAATGLLVLLVVVVGGGGGGEEPPRANLWIDRTGGACARTDSPAEYADAAACRSLDAALAAARPGDSVLVRAGRYAGQTVSGAAGGAGERRVTIAAAEGESVVVAGTLRLARVDGVIVEGLSLRGGTGLSLDRTRGVVVRRNSLVATDPAPTSAGIQVTGSCCAGNADLLIEDNHIDRRGVGDGIDLAGGDADGLTIRGNLIEDVGEDHLHLDARTPGPPVVVEDNVLRDANPQAGAHSDAIQFTKDGTFVVRRNVLDATQHGFVVTDTDNAGPTIRWENNLIVGNGSGADFNDGAPCAGGYVRHNTVIGTVTSQIDSCRGEKNGNVFASTLYRWGAGGEDYNVFVSDGGWTLGPNSTLGHAPGEIFRGGRTGTENVYPPRVVAHWPRQMDTIVDPRLECSSSPALARANPANVPATDLLGRTRSDPDAGAYECLDGDG